MSTVEPIVCRAAVAWAAKQPLTVETIRVEPPRKGEVRIRILYTSVCHTDQYTLGGSDPEAVFPCILGHEGAGIVESVGEGVSSVAPGDHVVPLYLPQCRQCKMCKHPKTNLCSTIRLTQGRGLMSDSTSRFSTLDGKMIYHYMGTSTFSEYTVLPEISVSRVDAGAPLDRVALLGCGVSTGYGAALNVADVQAGDTVAVFGLGTVGLAVVWGARERGASKIIGVDTNERRLELAKSFGVTDTLNPDKLEAPVEDVLIGMTDGGCDHTFECIGNVQVMRSAFLATHKGWGQSVVIGVAGAGQEVSARPFNLIVGRTWKGCAFGGWKSRDSVPELVQRYMAGRLEVDRFITHRESGPESLNRVFDILNSGESLRCVVGFNEMAANK